MKTPKIPTAGEAFFGTVLFAVVSMMVWRLSCDIQTQALVSMFNTLSAVSGFLIGGYFLSRPK